MFFLKRLFKKEEPIKPIRPIPSWEEIVERLYEIQYVYADELIRVFYSKDKTMRYVILRDEEGIYRYHLEEIVPFDEDEWAYICRYEDALPAMWETPAGSCCGSHMFANEEDLMKELKCEPEFKEFFELNRS